MRSHVEAFVKDCERCRAARCSAIDTTHSWPKCEKLWSRLHIDWVQHSKVPGCILIVADSTSGWLEAVIRKDRRTETVTECLREIFARFGVPELMVLDNAPEFVCQQFRSWLEAIDCGLTHSPECRPQSNGLAERMVRVVKDSLKCFDPSKCSAEAYLQRLLFEHRNTVIRGGQTPAEILFRYYVRCTILSPFFPFVPSSSWRACFFSKVYF